MDAITHTEAKKNFKQVLKRVCDDHAPLIITRQKKKLVFMMSLEDYNSIEETLYLLKSPKNAARLAKAFTEIEQKKFSIKVQVGYKPDSV